MAYGDRPSVINAMTAEADLFSKVVLIMTDVINSVTGLRVINSGNWQYKAEDERGRPGPEVLYLTGISYRVQA